MIEGDGQCLPKLGLLYAAESLCVPADRPLSFFLHAELEPGSNGSGPNWVVGVALFGSFPGPNRPALKLLSRGSRLRQPFRRPRAPPSVMGRMAR